MPTLIQNHKKQEIVTRLKKFYSTLSQAVEYSELENGPAGSWENPGSIKDAEGKRDNAVSKVLALDYFNKYLKPYLKTLDVIEETDGFLDEAGNDAFFRVVLNDGTYFYFKFGSCADIRVDVNGKKFPNEYGKDVFAFLICPDAWAKHFCGTSNKYLCPYGMHNKTREELLAACKSSPELCSALIVTDGWQIKDDYPW